MGFQFSAIATSKVFSVDNISDISNSFKCPELIFIEEVIFEESLEINLGSEFLDILFLNNGTLIFTSNTDVSNMLNIENISAGAKVGSFAVDEMSMVMMVTFYEDGILKKDILQHNSEILLNTENDFTLPYSSGFELITKLIENITGESFYSHEPDAVVYRYEFK